MDHIVDLKKLTAYTLGIIVRRCMDRRDVRKREQLEELLQGKRFGRVSGDAEQREVSTFHDDYVDAKQLTAYTLGIIVRRCMDRRDVRKREQLEELLQGKRFGRVSAASRSSEERADENGTEMVEEAGSRRGQLGIRNESPLHSGWCEVAAFGKHPFILRRWLKMADFDGKIGSIAAFPQAWSINTALVLSTLWGRTSWYDPALAGRISTMQLDPEKWSRMVETFRAAFIVTGDEKLFIMGLDLGGTKGISPPISLSLPPAQSEKVQVCWALSPDKPYEPLVIFSVQKKVYIFNVVNKTVQGRLQGHGGEITSISVHPGAPHIFCTTSRDFSTRIYDLTRTPHSEPNNPHWPPLKTGSRAGPAHGLDMSIAEGSGTGRCVLILVGGRSGGHEADVLAAAFNKTYPVIATCGIDRAVKIWHVPLFSEDWTLIREDKPLFSSSRIHAGRVLSVTWLAGNTLLTHSGPFPLMADPIPPDPRIGRVHTGTRPGNLALWNWSSVDRFFPEGWDSGDSMEGQQVLSGFASDFQESDACSLLANYTLPESENEYCTPTLEVCTGRGPLVVLSTPKSRVLTLVNVSLFVPVEGLSLPMWQDDSRPDATAPRLSGKALEGWTISLDERVSAVESIESCAMNGDGTLMFVGGSKGSVWILFDKTSV